MDNESFFLHEKCGQPADTLLYRQLITRLVCNRNGAICEYVMSYPPYIGRKWREKQYNSIFSSCWLMLNKSNSKRDWDYLYHFHILYIKSSLIFSHAYPVSTDAAQSRHHLPVHLSLTVIWQHRQRVRYLADIDGCPGSSVFTAATLTGHPRKLQWKMLHSSYHCTSPLPKSFSWGDEHFIFLLLRGISSHCGISVEKCFRHCICFVQTSYTLIITHSLFWCLKWAKTLNRNWFYKVNIVLFIPSISTAFFIWTSIIRM